MCKLGRGTEDDVIDSKVERLWGCDRNKEQVQSQRSPEWEDHRSLRAERKEKKKKRKSARERKKKKKSLICDPSVLTRTLLWLVPRRGGKASCMCDSN